MTDSRDDDLYQAGMKARRAVLGNAHVDRAQANTKPYTQAFQDFITRFAWGSIWTRPGFDHRTRRILVIGTMMALGRWEEFRMHVRAALVEGGFTLADIEEICLQQAVYCGVPISNTAFHHLETVLAELKERGVSVQDGTR